MDNLSLKKLVNFLPKVILVFLIFILPLFFLPQTVDIFEFPKQILLWVSVLLLIILTLLKFAVDGQVKFLKTSLLYPILLFLLVYLVSGILAPDRNLAFLGFFGRPNAGFLAIFATFAIFYFVSFYLEQLKEIFLAVWAVLASIFTLSILAILYYFGIFLLPAEATKINSFSPAGGIFVLSQILGVCVPILLGILTYFQFSGQNGKFQRWAKLGTLYITLLITVSAVILANTLVGWVGLGIGLIVFFLFFPQDKLAKLLLPLLPIVIISILVGILTQTPLFREKGTFLDVTLAKPQILSLTTSWQVTAGAVRDYPILGSGPASFLSDFTRFRPTQLNLTNAWNLKFVQSGSLYLDILATVGILGLITWLFIVFKYAQSFVNFVPTAQNLSIFPVKLGLSASIIGLLASFVFYSFSTVGLFLLAVLLGLFFSLAQVLGSTIVAEVKFEAKKLAPFLVILALFFLLGFWLIWRNLIANFSYFSAQQAAAKNDIVATQRSLVKAISYNPNEDTYWADLARVNLAATFQILQKQDLKDEEQQRALQILDLAIRQARKATQIAPSKVVNWELLGDIYGSYASQIQGAADSALQAYSQAVLLDPPNPNLWLKIGNLLAFGKNLDSVIDTFKQAVRLKPNLVEARIYLARAFELKGEYQASKEQYEIAKKLTDTLEPGEVKTRISEQINQRLEFVKTKTATPSAPPPQVPIE